MKKIYQKIWELAKPYLDTRHNEIHTKIATAYAFKLMELEGGKENIIIPAIILHDTGWKHVPEKLHLKSFGPKKDPQLTKVHAKASGKIAKKILNKVGYDKKMIDKILNIVGRHDSDKKPSSLDEKIVRDADKLWRFSKKGFAIDCQRFDLSPTELATTKSMDIDQIFCINSSKKIARAEILKRLKS